MKIRVGCVLSACLFFAPLNARAALTDSEQAQIVGLVRESIPEKAARVRALLGRPDLSPSEIAAPLTQAYRLTTFDEQRARFSEALLFGVGAAASRDQLALGLTTALMVRADKLLSELPHTRPSGAIEPVARRAEEAQRLHAFISSYLASREVLGAPSNIRDETRRALVEVYRAHVLANQWIFSERLNWQPLLRLRVQTALTAMDLGQDVVEPAQIAEWLGLSGARRVVFERYGTFVDDGGTASPARLDAAIGFLSKAMPDTREYSVWWLNKARLGPLVTTRRIASTTSFLSAEEHRAPAKTYWSKEAAGDAKVDGELAEVLLSIAKMAVASAFNAEPSLRQAAAVAATAAAKANDKAAYLAQDLLTGPDGSPQSSEVVQTPELFAAHSLRVLLLDPQLTMKAVVLGLDDEQNEPLAQVALGLSILGRTESGAKGEVVIPTLNGGAAARFSALKIEASVVRGFTSEGKSYTLDRGEDGALSVNRGLRK